MSNEFDSAIPFVEIIDYLNYKTRKKFRASTQKTRKDIKARWQEGFRLEDFKQVIDKKTAQWLTNVEMNRYLRPETLFGTKFESYLNEQAVEQHQSVKIPMNDEDIDLNAGENW